MFSPLQTDIAPSRVSRYCYLITTLTALFSVWYAGFSLVVSGALTLLLLFVVTRSLPYLVFNNHKSSVTSLRWVAEHKLLSVKLNGGAWQRVELIKQRICWPFLLSAHLVLEDQRSPVVIYIWRDSVPAEAFRRLIVLWRLASQPANAIRN